jgi:hypothetical protein
MFNPTEFSRQLQRLNIIALLQGSPQASQSIAPFASDFKRRFDYSC